MALGLALTIGSQLIGSGISAAQAVDASKKRKEAEAAADDAIAILKALSYEDTMAGLQVPMMGFEQSAEKQAQREAMQIQALQEAGAEAALGGTAPLAVAGSEEDLARMAQIDQLEYARNLELARNKQQIANLNLGMQAGIAEMELAGAQQAAAMAETMKQQALTAAGKTIAQGGIDIYELSALYPTQKTEMPGSLPSFYGQNQTFGERYGSLSGALPSPQYGIGKTPTPSYAGALEIPKIGSQIPYHPILNPFNPYVK